MQKRKARIIILLFPFRPSIVVEKEIPLDIDSGLLTVTDLNPLDFAAYK